MMRYAQIDLQNDSEGEIGDNKIYAERANGMKLFVPNTDPVPKF